MKPIPTELLNRPFTTSGARQRGVSDRMLAGRRFVRILPGVHRHRELDMTAGRWIEAARLVLPEGAQLTGITRIQQLGLHFGPELPVRFVVEGDHHLSFDEIFLHRTTRLPPLDDVGVTPAAAFISYCRRARVIDAIKVGDWLLHQGHVTEAELRHLALGEQWRDGAVEALWVLEHLDPASRSLPESECRAILSFAGLPIGEVNRRLTIDDAHLIGDLVFEQWRTVVEYEGAHHQADRAQYASDIDRYAVMRGHDIAYVQVTKEKLKRPRLVTREVHRELVTRGYDGPPPDFGHHWHQLFERITDVIGPRLDRRQSSGA